jgi:hypothetical protein
MFYFHMRQGDQFLEDYDGSELSGLEAALQTAREDARALIAERIELGRLVEPYSIEITDADGLRLALVTFEEVLRELAPWV